MDVHHHKILTDFDAARHTQHEAALREWQAGPFAAWQASARGAAKGRGKRPARPTAPAAPKPIQPALFAVAAEHGVSVDDLVRSARKTEIRTVYRAGQIDGAVRALDEQVTAGVLALEWPSLPAVAPTTPAPPALEFHAAAPAAASGPPPKETREARDARRRSTIDRHTHRPAKLPGDSGVDAP